MKLDAPPSNLGKVGVWTWPLVTAPADHIRSAARAIEDMGYGAIWYPESRGREAIALAAIILGATESIPVATGIASIWARDANAAAGAAMALGEAWPGRFTLGLGVSHAPSVKARGEEYRQPVKRMAGYLDAMEASIFVGPEPAQPVPVILAALGPRMLRLAAEKTAGAHPYFVPVEHTTFAREIIGDEAYLAPEQAVVLESDPGKAREAARQHMERYLMLDNYRRNLLRLGWKERDLNEGGSDAVVDAIVAWGPPEAIAERVAAHHAAGADHVSIQVLGDPASVPLAELEVLASELL
ncbi:MAG: TIGR03620 family F420-dependent LLM class oxidoreductase [Acidimicrobiia bacterium]